MVVKSYFNEKRANNSNGIETKTLEETSSKSYLLGLWNENICIPYNVQCDMYDGAYLCYLIIFTYVSSQCLFSSYKLTIL